jgi:hypothetical protein
VPKYVFAPTNQSARELLNRMVKAGHRDVLIFDGNVHMRPFEEGDADWIGSMERHFECVFVEIE